MGTEVPKRGKAVRVMMIRERAFLFGTNGFGNLEQADASLIWPHRLPLQIVKATESVCSVPFCCQYLFGKEGK